MDPHHSGGRRHRLPDLQAGASAGLELSAADTAHAPILAAVRAIPAGQVMGYGEVARRACLPGRARLVAKLLSANEDPTLPWHRVLRSDGRIAFAPGSAGFREQCRRLQAEGVVISAGRVARTALVTSATLDEQLWS